MIIKVSLYRIQPVATKIIMFSFSMMAHQFRTVKIMCYILWCNTEPDEWNQLGLIFFSAAHRAARKTFLHLATRNCHLRGISGPGAPHVFAYDRRSDLLRQGGPRWYFFCSPSLVCKKVWLQKSSRACLKVGSNNDSL